MRVAALALAFAVVPSLGLAQIGNPGFMAPDTRFEKPGVPDANQRNANDVLFAQLLTEGSLAEIALGELAADRAEVSAVGEFARRMIDDHSAANEKLSGIAEQTKIPLPEELNEEHVAMRDRLQELDGREFDIAYMRGQVVDHQKAVLLLIWEIDDGQSKELKQYAAATLPTVMEHLRLAREIVTDLTHDRVAEAAPATAPEAAPRPADR